MFVLLKQWHGMCLTIGLIKIVSKQADELKIDTAVVVQHLVLLDTVPRVIYLSQGHSLQLLRRMELPLPPLDVAKVH